MWTRLRGAVVGMVLGAAWASAAPAPVRAHPCVYPVDTGCAPHSPSSHICVPAADGAVVVCVDGLVAEMLRAPCPTGEVPEALYERLCT